MMNLNHRVAEGKEFRSLELVMHQIQKPLSWFIPLLLLLVSWWKVFEYFGQEWDIGSFSTAFVPMISTFISEMFDFNSAMVSASIVLIGYLLGPLTFYFFVYQLTKRHLTALIVGMLTLMPLNIFSSQVPERLILALQSNDGAHILGLTFIPLAAAMYLFFIRTGSIKYLFLVGFWEIVVCLLSFFAQFILIFFYLFITLSEALISQGRIKFLRFGQLLLVHAVISIVVYNFSLWGIIVSEQGQTTVQVLSNLLPLAFFIVPVVGTFAFLIFDRRPALQPLFIAGSFFLMFGLMHFVRTSFVDIPLLAQDRYAAEMSFALSLLLGILITWGFDLIRAGKLINRYPILVQNKTNVAFGSVIFILFLLGISLLFIPRSL